MITLLWGVILVLVIVYLIARMGPREHAVLTGTLTLAQRAVRPLLLTLLTLMCVGWLVIVFGTVR